MCEKCEKCVCVCVCGGVVGVGVGLFAYRNVTCVFFCSFFRFVQSLFVFFVCFLFERIWMW